MGSVDDERSKSWTPNGDDSAGVGVGAGAGAGPGAEEGVDSAIGVGEGVAASAGTEVATDREKACCALRSWSCT